MITWPLLTVIESHWTAFVFASSQYRNIVLSNANVSLKQTNLFRTCPMFFWCLFYTEYTHLHCLELDILGSLTKSEVPGCPLPMPTEQPNTIPCRSLNGWHIEWMSCRKCNQEGSGCLPLLSTAVSTLFFFSRHGTLLLISIGALVARE